MLFLYVVFLKSYDLTKTQSLNKIFVVQAILDICLGSQQFLSNEDKHKLKVFQWSDFFSFFQGDGSWIQTDVEYFKLKPFL